MSQQRHHSQDDPSSATSEKAKTRTLPTGIRRLPNGKLQAYLVYRNNFHCKTFAPDAHLSDLKKWREDTRVELKYGITHKTGRLFEEDARTYLKAAALTVRSMAVRREQIQAWVDALHGRTRSSLTAAELTDIMIGWRTHGRNNGKPLAPGTVNGRRAALMAMFRSLDGKSQPNIVRDTPRFDDSASAQVRAVPLLDIARIVRHTKVWSPNRYRLHLFMWTGWPPQLIRGVTDADVDWHGSRVKLPARKKGKGQPSAWVPVLPAAMRVLRHMRRRGLIGKHYLNTSPGGAWETAQRDEKARRQRLDLPLLPRLRVYDIRHSFLTWAASIVKDDRALKELARSDMIERYTLGSEFPRMTAAIRSLHMQGRAEPSAEIPRQSRELVPRRARPKTQH